MTHSGEMPAESAPPKLPIPTGIAWMLLLSMEQYSWPKKIAQTAAIGAADMGKDEGRASEAFYKMLSKVTQGKQPRARTEAKFRLALRRGVLYLLQKAPGYSPEYIDHIMKHLDAATGPYAGLAIGFVPPSPNAAQQNLLDFSGRLDQLGAAFQAAADADDLDEAKDLFLSSNLLDEAYWSFPQPGQEDPRHNREALRTAKTWEELTRAAVPLIVNTTLSWLSCLDLAVLAGGRDPAAYFPLFLPLAARFTPEALSAIQEGRPPPVEKWSDCVELPVPNLIRMLKNIASETTRNIQKRAKPPKLRYADTKEREALSAALQKIGRHDMLSLTQFATLARVLEPTPRADLQPGEGCGFDISALHLAANLFSLLTPREGNPPTNGSRRERPQSITIFGGVPDVYERWWRRNLKDVTGETVESPRPAWFTSSLGETAQPNRPD